MDDTQILKSTQEQAVASWINQLNQIRLDDLVEKLTAQDCNLENALDELQKFKDFIGTPEHILGNPTTKAGEIAEHAQVNFNNARRLVQGLKTRLSFDGVGRTAPEDFLYRGAPIQSKAYGPTWNKGSGSIITNGEQNTIKAIREHMQKYPDFLQHGGDNKGRGYYVIPKDYYENITSWLKKPLSELNRTEYRAVKAVRQLEEEMGAPFEERVKSSVIGYSDAQLGRVHETAEKEESNIREIHQERRNASYEQSKPTLAEGAHAAGVSAAIEGGTRFILAVRGKLKDGKKLTEFTAEDWKDVGLDTAKGAATGGIRGAAIYGMTNFTAAPAAVASAFVTAAFGVAAQARQLEQGAISENDFVCNSTVLCLDVSISAIASLAGQVLIPIPVLGAVIGNCAGLFYWSICKDFASERECILADAYRQDMQALNAQLHAQYLELLARLQREFEKFESMQQLAFDEDVNRAFAGSVELALFVGVPEQKILTGAEQIDQFFTT